MGLTPLNGTMHHEDVPLLLLHPCIAWRSRRTKQGLIGMATPLSKGLFCCRDVVQTAPILFVVY